MKIFNKAITLSLVFALLFGLMPGSKAQTPDTILLSQPLADRTLYITSIAAHEGTLYIKANTGLYRYAPGDEDAVLLLDYSGKRLSDEDADFFEQLLSDGQTLYAMNSQKGKLRPIIINNNKVSLGELKQLDWSMFIVEEDEYSYTNPPESLVLSDNYLYMLSSDNMGRMTLLRASLDTGEVQTYENLPFIKKLTPYKDGKLLALLFDDENSFDQQAGRIKAPDLAIFDPRGATLDLIGPLLKDMEGYWSTVLAYDTAQDKLYFIEKNIVYYRQALGEAVACTYLPAEPGHTDTPPLQVLESGRLAALTATGIALREDNPEKLKSTDTLMIAGGYTDFDMFNRVASQMPEVRVDWQSVHYYTNEALVQAMLSRSADADIFMLHTAMNLVSSFIQKGYAQQLPADGEAAKATAAMYPMIRDVAEIDGKAYALPIALEFSVNMVRKELFKKVGQPVPEDFFAVCDALQQWAGEYKEKYPEYQFWTSFDNKEMLYDLALEVYRDELRARGEDFHFDTELFRSMMARIEEMDTQAIDHGEFDFRNPDSVALMDEMSSKTALVERWYVFNPYLVHQPHRNEIIQDIQLFAAQPGTEAVTAADVLLLAINPYSKNPEAALRFIDLYAAAMPPMARVILMPGENEPILNPNYDKSVASAQENITRMENQIAENQTKGLPVSEMEAELKKVQTFLRDEDSSLRYLLTKDDISLMRSTIDRVYIPTVLHRLEELADFYGPFSRYAAGTLSLDQFIKEADNKLRLVRLENQ